jgi:rSAM/selenodomain-associated transferase 1
MTASLNNVLIIFVKYPEPGFVKTRLAEKIGKDKAAFLYRLFVETILARTEDIGFRRIIFCHPPEKSQGFKDWLGDNEVYFQKGDTLGERLSNAFEFIFEKGAKRVIAIGSDSPTIDGKLIIKAFNKLESKECVIGPAQDGGYYLIGLSHFHREIFKDINWSTKDVFSQTKDKVNKLGLEFSILDKEIDIDSFDDLLVLKDRLKDAYKTNPIGLTPLLNFLD